MTSLNDEPEKRKGRVYSSAISRESLKPLRKKDVILHSLYNPIYFFARFLEVLSQKIEFYALYQKVEICQL